MGEEMKGGRKRMTLGLNLWYLTGVWSKWKLYSNHLMFRIITTEEGTGGLMSGADRWDSSRCSWEG